MKYIHEKPNWPKFIWDIDVIALRLAEVRYRQGKYLGGIEALGLEARSEANLSILTSEVLSTTLIEGEKLNAKEVRSSLARNLGFETAGLPLPGREVEGIVEMMLDATKKFSEPLNSERLFSWHAALFPTGRSGMRRIAVGAWRTKESGPMQVVSGPIGREKVHFEAPDSSRLQSEMTKFFKWFNSSTPIDPVLKAGVAHLWFVTIHPFEDGNGRIARAIAELMLSRADGTEARYYSMSSRIQAERKDYYRKLEATQRGDLNITMWLEWFLGCLAGAIDDAEQALARVIDKAKFWQGVNQYPLNDRERNIIKRLLDGFLGNLSASKYAKLAKCSTDTALRDINELLGWGILEKNPGGGRSTSYKLGSGTATKLAKS